MAAFDVARDYPNTSLSLALPNQGRRCRQCGRSIRTINKSGLCRQCRYPNWGRAAGQSSCRQCGQANSQHSRSGLCRTCLAARSCPCGAPLRFNCQTGVCRACYLQTRCLDCGRYRNISGRNRCSSCLAAPPLPRSPRATRTLITSRHAGMGDFGKMIEANVAEYTRRVEQQLPLFERVRS